MEIEKLRQEYNYLLKAYQNYIRVLELPEEQKISMLKLFRCQDEPEAIENIKVLQRELSQLMK
jgi:hypothetical protein